MSVTNRFNNENFFDQPECPQFLVSGKLKIIIMIMAYLSLATGNKRETVLKLEVMRCTCPFIPTKSKKDSHSVVGLSFAFHELVTENVPNIQQKMNL